MAERHGPVRTCIGCRERVARDELARHVLEHAPDGSARVVRDRGLRLPGRGAWLHDDDRCRQLATKRRAFRRALRVAGDVELHVVEPHDEAGHVSTPELTDRGSGSRR